MLACERKLAVSLIAYADAAVRGWAEYEAQHKSLGDCASVMVTDSSQYD